MASDDKLDSDAALKKAKKTCFHCNKDVRSESKCKKCGYLFHPACLRQAAGLKSAVCAHETEESDPITSKRDLSQIDVLRILVEELRSKNKILEENNDLLREKVTTLEEKLRAGKKGKHNQYPENVALSLLSSPRPAAPASTTSTSQDSQAPVKQNSQAALGGTQALKPPHIPKIQSDEIVDIEPQPQAASTSAKKRSRKASKSSADVTAISVVEITNAKNPRSSNAQGMSTLSTVSSEDDILRKDVNKNNDWQKVTYKRKHTPVVNKNSRPEPLRGQNEKTVSLRPATRKASLFLSGLDLEVTTDEIQAFLKEQNLSPAVSCDKMKTKKQKFYSSFKLTVPYEKVDEYMCADVWPKGIVINHFRNLQHPSKGTIGTPNA